MSDLEIKKTVGLLVCLITIIIAIMLISSEGYAPYGQSLLVALSMIPIIYLFTNYCLNYKKNKRWNQISRKVLKDLGDELKGIFIDISNFGGIDRSFTGPLNTTNEEISEILRKEELNQIKEIATKKNFKISENHKDRIINGGCGTIFEKREEYLNQFQLKYLEYFDAKIVIALMDLQKAFHYINQDIVIRNKQMNNNWMRLDTDEQVIIRIESNMQTIVSILQFLLDEKIFYNK